MESRRSGHSRAISKVLHEEKKGKDSLLLDVSDYTNGASSNNGKNIKDSLYFCLVFSV